MRIMWRLINQNIDSVGNMEAKELGYTLNSSTLRNHFHSVVILRL
jgi:hypothetical protein